MPRGVYKRPPFTQEWKDNIGKALTGRKHSKETLEKMKKAKKGKHYPKMSEAKKRLGLRPPSFKGKKHTVKTKKKLSKSFSGEKHWNWKGGITPENRKIKNGIEYRLWREAVFARDNWTCQKSGIKSGMGKAIILHPHHIKNFSKYPELRFAIDNGITLSEKAHDEFHKIYGRRNNTKEQLEEFLI